MVSEHYVHHVSGPLAQYVSSATGYHVDGVAAGVHVGLPSRTLTLVVPMDDPLVLSGTTAGGGDRPAPYLGVLAGLHTHPTWIHHDGRQRGLQLALTPAGARALFGLPAAQVAEESVELADVVGRVAMTLRDRLHELGTWQERFAALDGWLTKLLGDKEIGVKPEVAEAWRVVGRTRGAVPVWAVANHVGWSMRQLQQSFSAEYGVTPKQAARVARFEWSVRLARDPSRRLADIAATCGYADQAHLAREWRALAGLPPSRWRAEDGLAFVQDSGPCPSAD